MQNPINCYTCNQNHSCRDCPIEKQMAPILKEAIGHYMEYIAAGIICCPKCSKKTLRVYGDKSSSKDIECEYCGLIIEVKSKALSYKRKKDIPSHLLIPHGSYHEYKKRVNEGLHIILLLYSIDRKNKMIQINQVFHIPNKILKKEENNIVNVTKRPNSHLSNIEIKNKELLKEIIPSQLPSISFFNEFEVLRQHLNI